MSWSTPPALTTFGARVLLMVTVLSYPEHEGVGAAEGEKMGEAEGAPVGHMVGAAEGEAEGAPVRLMVGGVVKI